MIEKVEISAKTVHRLTTDGLPSNHQEKKNSANRQWSAV
jgi:hypothetical protein